LKSHQVRNTYFLLIFYYFNTTSTDFTKNLIILVQLFIIKSYWYDFFYAEIIFKTTSLLEFQI